MEPLPQIIVSKSEFAVLKNVSGARVTQWIKAGKIKGAALVGDGRGARINVALADEQLKKTLDLGRRLVNGAATRADAVSYFLETRPLGLVARSAEEEKLLEKLGALQRRNGKRAQDDARAVRHGVGA